MNRRNLLSCLLATVLAVPLAGAVSAQEAWPAKPIQIVVPWAAGGATDAVMRIVATEVSNALKVPVSVVNQTGASGTVGTNAVLQAPRDGYTWASGGVQDLGTYKVQGLLDTALDDWELFLVVRNAPVLSVSPDSPFQNPCYAQFRLLG